MEKKINIAKLLKDCPKGIELYSPLCGDCKLYDVNDYNIRIETSNKDTLICLYHDGRYCANGEIMLFPKGKTTWEGFQRPFKDGDILSYQHKDFKNRTIYIYMQHSRMNTTYYVALSGNSNSDFMVNDKKGQALNSYNDSVRLATEEEKQKLFDAIKAKGYRWNKETKTLEKLIILKFKVGDRIKKKGDYISGIITKIDNDNFYKVEYDQGHISFINSENQDDYELVSHIKPKFKTGNKIEKCGYKFTIAEVKDDYYLTKCENKIPIDNQDDFSLVLNKFDIDTLKPFDKVLVRNDNSCWRIEFFERINKKNKNYPFVCMYGHNYKQCIPYEGNEHLLYTAKDCDEYYKTW